MRAAGIVFALAAEALLIMAVLSIGWIQEQKKRAEQRVTTVDVRPARQPPKPAAVPKPPRQALQQPQAQPQQRETPPLPVPPDAPRVQAIIPLSKSQMAVLDIANLPRQPAPAPKAAFGPRDTGVPGDSKRVGTAPDGQPMYAAAWYREPYDNELRGYLSTAQGPSWALITCRTAENWRVEDCVGLSEWPENSRMMRAVLAAAWQFQVRPPRVGGVSKVGEWVRIRIEYTSK